MERRKLFLKKLNIVMALLVCIMLVLSVPFDSYATGTYDWDSEFNEPVVGEYGGYIVLMYEDLDTGRIFYEVYVWDFDDWAVSYDTVPTVDIVVADTYFQITPFKPDSSNYTLYRLRLDGVFELIHSGCSDPSYKLPRYSDERNVGFQINGHHGVILTAGRDDWYTPSVIWTGQVDNTKLVSLLNNLLSKNNDIINRLDWLYGSTMTIEQQIAELKEIQLEQMSWLERIFYKLEDLFDKDEDIPQEDVSGSDEKIDSASKDEEEVLDDIDGREQTNEERKEQIEQIKEDGIVEQSGTWSVFNGVLGANPKIMNMIVTVLSIAVVGLIFNR